MKTRTVAPGLFRESIHTSVHFASAAGTRIQLFPETISGDGIYLSPSEPETEQVASFEALMEWVNSDRHRELLEAEGLLPPDYISASSHPSI